MASFFDINQQSLTYVTSKLINATGSGGGTNIPPPQIGPGRIPVVNGVKLASSQVIAGGAQYAITWDDIPPGSNVSNYNVWVTGALGNNQAPIGPYATTQSPCYLRIVATTAGILTFFVQTVLTNGGASDISSSPCCTGISVNPGVSSTTQTFNLTGPAAFGCGSTNEQINCDLTSGSVNINLNSLPTDGLTVKVTVTATGGGHNVTVNGISYVIVISGSTVNSYTFTSGTATFTYNANSRVWVGS